MAKMVEENSVLVQKRIKSWLLLKEKQRGYQAVARHYKHALNRMFLQLNHSALIIVEDDLDVASDFFQYFAGTLPLLMANQNLFCVSAWNDNGRPDLIDLKRSDLLYRTDFFAGLGWMLLRSFWLEIHAGWPDIFWDEYLRKPYVRKNRACLRPEVGRTTTFGRMGISRGQFFDKYLSTMRLNHDWQNFVQMNLTYLHEPGDLPNISTTPTERIRVTYHSQADFDRIAIKLNLMRDIKSGVMRNAFAGVVPTKWKDQWIYINKVFSANPVSTIDNRRNKITKGIICEQQLDESTVIEVIFWFRMRDQIANK
ncbi:unnamed protein product [Echinostoma caproni]|uniref:Alpha-1,3-mannosyl-glycoprotein 2-beta-N-acetylglucosaminyltransferase n=1 Tax=Echinostoma caproni TaxID=27848 RepID=A0A183AKH1_9TREM|nr:unnamed protein product [Echinostoma caproni]